MEEWLEAINEEIRELKALTLETRKMAVAAEKTAKAAEQTAKAAQQQAVDSRYLLEKHIEWHQKPVWKRMFGI